VVALDLVSVRASARTPGELSDETTVMTVGSKPCDRGMKLRRFSFSLNMIADFLHFEESVF
jgi:hypothetical protein